jgi:hypothetical protein
LALAPRTTIWCCALIDVLVLDVQHLALTTASFQCADDPVVHRGSDPIVLGCVHRHARRKELLLLVSMDSPVSFVLVPAFDADAETMERRR